MKSYNQEEFNRMVSDNDLEVFTADQLQSFAKQADLEIQKSEGSKEEIMKAVADEIRTFTPNKVWGLNNYGQLDSKIMFTRSQQVEWEPVEGDEIQKSRGGVYKDTPENRKLGRVGRKFGGVKDEGKEENKYENFLQTLDKDYDVKPEHLKQLDRSIKNGKSYSDAINYLIMKNNLKIGAANVFREFLSKNEEEQPKGEEKNKEFDYRDCKIIVRKTSDGEFIASIKSNKYPAANKSFIKIGEGIEHKTIDSAIKDSKLEIDKQIKLYE